MEHCRLRGLSGVQRHRTGGSTQGFEIRFINRFMNRFMRQEALPTEQAFWGMAPQDKRSNAGFWRVWAANKKVHDHLHKGCRRAEMAPSQANAHLRTRPFSGGQDSATCLAWALDRYEHVETIGFDYGQRHKIELACRDSFLASLRKNFPTWDQRLGGDHVLDMGLLSQISDTALTQAKSIEFEKTGLPNTFVPGRNLLFFTFAATLAYRRELTVLVGGMCETDYSGYPDCRDDTLKSLQVTLSLGLDSRTVIETPLMWLDKAATWTLAEKLGGQTLVSMILEDTHTCYLGDRSRKHAWGYGCGHCPACELRKKGYEKYSEGTSA